MKFICAVVLVFSVVTTATAGEEQDYIISKLNQQYQGYRARVGTDTSKRNLLRTVYSNASKQISRMSGLSGRTVAEAAAQKMSDIVTGNSTDIGRFVRTGPAPSNITPTEKRTCYLCNPGNGRNNKVERVCMTASEYGARVGGAARNGSFSSCKLASG